VSALDALRGVARIARAASVGVSGNLPRLERAERAITAFEGLLALAKEVAEKEGDRMPAGDRTRLQDAISACEAA